MGVIGKAWRLGAAEFARPVNDVFDPQQEKQRGRLDQHHPQIRQAGQCVNPHLWYQHAPERLPRVHAVSFGGFQLRPRHRTHCTKEHIGCESPKDDGKGQNGQRKTI